MTLTANDGRTVFSATEPSTPRLRLQSGAAPELLDGGWWPRSADPVAEIPGLVLAIDVLQGPIARLILHDSDWDSHPRRLAVAGRLVRVGYFSSQPVGLLTALSGRAGARVDLVVIPPDTEPDTAETAMRLAATSGNLVHAQSIVSTVAGSRSSSGSRSDETAPEDVWETDGGRLAVVNTTAHAG
ncbi:DUF5994 family protein [Kribbella sp. NPDC049227]|uniref:DUF5994 family protein n=1 Tax=Kribbella sp. NPDC049227 TaxID=3364113 RepID=UPI00371E0C5E